MKRRKLCRVSSKSSGGSGGKSLIQASGDVTGDCAGSVGEQVTRTKCFS